MEKYLGVLCHMAWVCIKRAAVNIAVLRKKKKRREENIKPTEAVKPGDGTPLLLSLLF